MEIREAVSSLYGISYASGIRHTSQGRTPFFRTPEDSIQFNSIQFRTYLGTVVHVFSVLAHNNSGKGRGTGGSRVLLYHKIMIKIETAEVEYRESLVEKRTCRQW